MQDSDWSRALRGWLEGWLGVRPTRTCGTDEASRDRYGESLANAGFQVAETSVDYTDDLDVERIVGGVFSSLSADQLPPQEERSAVAERIRTAVEPHGPFLERVRVTILIGRIA